MENGNGNTGSAAFWLIIALLCFSIVGIPVAILLLYFMFKED